VHGGKVFAARRVHPRGRVRGAGEAAAVAWSMGGSARQYGEAIGWCSGLR